MNPPAILKATPLLEVHKQLGGKIVPFAGWHMPIQYKGVIDEHLAVRNSLGLFDVSHMGEIEVRGPQAREFLQRLVTNDIDKMYDGSVLYSLMCYEHGGVVDDLLVHRFSESNYFLCVNASNADKDFEWAQQQASGFDVELENTSDQWAQFALQGKQSEASLQPLCSVPLQDLKYYHFVKGDVCGVESLIARTGYTGEDGFEIYLNRDAAVDVFQKLLEAGKPYDIQPIGLGARDTLRLEMGYALYGNEITENILPLPARLGWVVALNKAGGFVGCEAIQQLKQSGVKQKLTALKLLERGIPRSHYVICHDGHAVGEVTSGTFSPSLNVGIALGYVPSEFSKPGTQLQVEIRKQKVSAEVVTLPFVPSGVKK